ncbi:MAG: alpha/beta hydrolase [Clostridia bacterium]|nr:alpha/beta hydrolase [Clostridia bacterium]
MNRFVLIHGMGSSLNSSFGPNIKKRLTNRGYKVIEPILSIKDKITLDSWINEMDSLEINDNANFLCHSLGATFIIKYLFHKKIKANCVIAVPGGLPYDDKQEGPWRENRIKNFQPTKAELSYFKKNVKYVYLIHSDNDPIFNQENFNTYIKNTGAIEIILSGCGHFGPKSGVKDIPEIEDILDRIEG